MLAPTHSIFGISLTLIILALFGIKLSLHWTIMVAAVFGALIPDIDLTRSTISKLCYPLSKFIEDNFGHRTMTHSLIGWGIATAVFSLLVGIIVWLVGANGYSPLHIPAIPHQLIPRWIAAFSIGYFSHLILDMFNPRGVNLLWPKTTRDVVSKNKKLRLAVGSGAEIVVFGILIIIMFASLPLSKYGLSSSLRWLLATPAAAIEEFKTLQTKTYLEFTGTFKETREQITGKAEILGVENKKLIIYFNNTVYTISDEIAADIMATQVRVARTTIPITIEHKVFQGQTRIELLAQVPSNSLVSGIVYLPAGLIIEQKKDSETLSNILPPTIQQKGNTLVLKYANKHQLEQLTADPLFQFEQKKDQLTLKKYQNQVRNIHTQIANLRKPEEGLTALGEELFGDKDARARKRQQIADLSLELDELAIQIEDVQKRLGDKRLVYSGEVWLRR